MPVSVVMLTLWAFINSVLLSVLDYHDVDAAGIHSGDDDNLDAHHHRRCSFPLLSSCLLSAPSSLTSSGCGYVLQMKIASQDLESLLCV